MGYSFLGPEGCALVEVFDEAEDENPIRVVWPLKLVFGPDHFALPPDERVRIVQELNVPDFSSAISDPLQNIREDEIEGQGLVSAGER